MGLGFFGFFGVEPPPYITQLFNENYCKANASQGPQGPQFTEAEPEAAPEDAADAEGAENAADAENAENAAGDMEGVESVPVEVNPFLKISFKSFHNRFKLHE